MSYSRARGFTLILMAIVLAILGLLAAMLIQSVSYKVNVARMFKAKNDIESLQDALTGFQRDNGKYPTTEQGLAALVLQPTDPLIQHWRAGGYLRHISKDPWSNEYHYSYPGTHGKPYDLYTLGADDKPGGKGADADIGNWNVND